MEMLRPGFPVGILGFGVMKPRVLIGARPSGLEYAPPARPGYAW